MLLYHRGDEVIIVGGGGGKLNSCLIASTIHHDCKCQNGGG